ncbi:DNA topology modulation protein FlaR [Lentzea sp. NBC_00516]|uniref:DNA topology modulation protein FlaR n=1 Tax=Lentzea sp. NBC_00516 TaxID=2903582 RepID=UPI002E81A00E|nr:DNA topology modulation protein FlaR [Lentzea sp. NBC_00516]WUD26739.1 DNA topology modulation protein FlaR [Lentzea sp. NBC_00516]
MQRVVILGRGGAGKSTLAAALGAATGLPVVELDQHFWGPGLEATPPDRWAVVQGELAAADRWIMDGDLGPYDVLDVRLHRADTVLLLDYSFPRCAWRALRRSRERADFWLWVWSWRRRHRPLLMNAIATHAKGARLRVFRNPRATARFVAHEVCGVPGSSPSAGATEAD